MIQTIEVKEFSCLHNRTGYGHIVIIYMENPIDFTAQAE
jgi:hypothetical protein